MVYRNDVPNSLKEKQFMTKSDLTDQLNNLDNLVTDLLFSLKPYTEEKLNAKPNDTAWSTLQICHHLILAEQGSLNYLKKKLSFNPKLKKSSLGTRMRQKLMTTYLSTPMKVKAPKGVGDEFLPTHSSLEQVTIQWKSLRADLRSYLFKLPDDIFEKEVYKHPFAGRLSIEGMLAFLEGHLKRHEKQIRKTLKMVG